MPPLPKEINKRQAQLARFLRKKGLDAALIRYPLHIFYFSGTFVDGHLLVTAQGKALLLVYRPYSRACEEASVEEVVPFRSLKALPGLLRDFGIKIIGLEYDRLPVKDFNRYQQLLTGFVLEDISDIIWRLRARKSPYEIECQRKAASMLAEALEGALKNFSPGVTELEAAGYLEASLRQRGHPAHTRVARWTQELAYGHVLFGNNATFPAYTTTGQGGAGVIGFPQGPSFRKLYPEDIILIDYAGWCEGYMVDQTRMFSWTHPSQKVYAIYQKVLDLMQELEEMLRPGIYAEEIYNQAQKLAKSQGLEEYFMAHGSEKVPFVGHGVGLEIDEWPPIASGVSLPLEAGMVVALEPKCHVPELGVIGVEDTFLITQEGAQRLTFFPREWKKLGI